MIPRWFGEAAEFGKAGMFGVSLRGSNLIADRSGPPLRCGRGLGGWSVARGCGCGRCRRAEDKKGFWPRIDADERGFNAELHDEDSLLFLI